MTSEQKQSSARHFSEIVLFGSYLELKNLLKKNSSYRSLINEEIPLVYEDYSDDSDESSEEWFYFPITLLTRGNSGEILLEDYKKIKLLIKYGANVNAKSEDGGGTPLMFMIGGEARILQKGQLLTIELLLQNGASVFVQDDDGDDIIKMIDDAISSFKNDDLIVFRNITPGNYYEFQRETHSEFDESMLFLKSILIKHARKEVNNILIDVCIGFAATHLPVLTQIIIFDWLLTDRQSEFKSSKPMIWKIAKIIKEFKNNTFCKYVFN